MSHAASGGKLHVGLELREVNGHEEQGYAAVCTAVRHSGRPVRLGFANVHGSAVHASGTLEVMVAGKGALGFSLKQESQGALVVGVVVGLVGCKIFYRKESQ